MGIIAKVYKKKMLHRYDKDGYTPYLSAEDFPNLHKETYSFINSLGVDISYFYYYYDGYKPNKIILFLHGLGPGHTAYMREIETLCKQGYKVLTLDYMGCDSSKGENMHAMNRPTADVDELLSHLSLKEEVVVMGHSLGGFTSMNIMRFRPEIHKAVVMSGFFKPDPVLKAFTGKDFYTKYIQKYEKKTEPKYFPEKLFEYFENTSDKFLFIHSKDDPIVNYNATINPLEQLNKDNFQFIKINGRGHNPNYTDESAKLVTKVFTEYYKLKKKEDIEKLMKNQSAWKLTEQDPEIFKKIFSFIEEA